MCLTEKHEILKSNSIKIKSQKYNCCNMPVKPFSDSSSAKRSGSNKSYLFSEALRKMLKSNHVQQSTEAYVKLSRGWQHMPEKLLAEYGWTVVDWVTAAQYKKLKRPHISELLWGDEHLRISVGDQDTEQSGSSGPWIIFLSERRVCLTALSVFHSFPSLETLQLAGVG